MEIVHQDVGDMVRITAQFETYIRSNFVMCYEITRKDRGLRTIWQVRTRRIKPEDLEKLGKTVFMVAADAYEKLGRLRDGN